MSGICSKHTGFVVGCPLCEAGLTETLVIWKADLEFLESCAEGLTTTERHLKIAVDYALALEARLKRAEGEVEFTKCVFDGAPPTGYEDWGTWASSKPKMGVFIRALEEFIRQPKALKEVKP